MNICILTSVQTFTWNVLIIETGINSLLFFKKRWTKSNYVQMCFVANTYNLWILVISDAITISFNITIQYPSCVLFAYIYVFVCNEFPFDDTWKQSTTRTHKRYWAVFRRIRIKFIHFQIKAQKHRNSIFEYKTKPMPLSLLLLLLNSRRVFLFSFSFLASGFRFQ